MMDFKRTSTLREETGAVAIIVAVAVTVFIGFLAYVVDVGYIYEMRRQLQSAADAAALAGMTDINTGGDGVAAAQNYARQNDVIEVSDPLTMQAAQVTSAGSSNPAFRVSVQKDADLFFGRIFGGSSSAVAATAQAKRVFITGTKGVVPLAMNTIKIRDGGLEANLNNGAFSTLGYAGGIYSRTFATAEIPTPATQQSYLVDLRITNSQGYVDNDSYVDVGSVTVHRPGDNLSNAWLNQNTLSPGATTTLRVTGARPNNYRLDGRNYNNTFTGSGNSWSSPITAPPSISAPLETYPIDIEVGSNNNRRNYANAAVLIVRTSNSPIENITMRNYHYFAGGTRPSIEVTAREFDTNYTNEYILKYDSNDSGLPGNYSALDFRNIWHPTAYTRDHSDWAGGAGGYEDALPYYPGVVHVSDKISSKSGGIPSATEDGLTARFMNCGCGCGSNPCDMTVDQWRATKPPGCKRLVKVPLVELFDKDSGKVDYIVVELASFFITSPIAELRNQVRGYFVPYVSGGETSQDDQPDGQYILGVRLERPNP